MPIKRCRSERESVQIVLGRAIALFLQFRSLNEFFSLIITEIGFKGLSFSRFPAWERIIGGSEANKVLIFSSVAWRRKYFASTWREGS